MEAISRRPAENGQTIILFVLALVVLLGIMALVADFGVAVANRAKMQHAADAAALAGAQLLPANPSGATDVARQIAIDNGAPADGLTVTITSNKYPSDSIAINIDHAVPAYFSRVLGFIDFDVKAASGSRSGSPSGVNSLIPLSLEESVYNSLAPGDVATLKYDAHNQMNGNSLALAFPGDDGAADYREALEDGTDETLCVYGEEYPGCVSVVSTETGQMVGPTQDALNARFAQTSSSCDSFDEVITSSQGSPGESRIKESCFPFAPYNVSSSKRLVLVPVIDHLCNGNCDVKIKHFAIFFLNGFSCTGGGNGSCSVEARLAEHINNYREFQKLGKYDPNGAFAARKLTQ